MKALASFAVVAGIVLMAYFAYVTGHGIATEEWHALQDSLVLAKQEVQHRDTIYRTDTIRYREMRTRYDTVAVTRAITVHDTVYVPKAVADSTIAACDSALAACGSLVFAAKAEARLWENRALLGERMLAAQKRRGLLEKIGTGLIGFGAGAAVCKL